MSYQFSKVDGQEAYVMRKDYLNLALLLLLAAATRFYRLGDASFWADEIFTLKFASLPWSTLWVSAYEPTPPLLYSILRPMLDVSSAEWWVRLPSAVAGTLTILFAYLAVKKIADSRAALATGLLLTLSIANIEYSQEARAYALVGMWIAMSFLGLASLSARWREDISGFSFPGFLGAGGALYGISVLAALYSHNVAVFYWLGAQVFFLAWWIAPCRFSRGPLLSWFAINLVVLVLWIPWLLASMQVIEDNMFTWLGQVKAYPALQIWRQVNTIQTGFAVDGLLDAVILLLTLWGLVSLRKNRSMAVALLAMLLLSSVVIWAYGFVSVPIFMRRTLLWGSIFSFALVGIGISRLPLLLGRLVLAVLLAAGMLGFYKYDQSHLAENTDWRSAAEVFSEQAGQDDILLFRTTWPARAFLFYVERDQSDRRILGWSCKIRQPLFGKAQVAERYPQVAWSEGDPGWKNNKLTESSVWLVENECHDPASITTSDNWLKQNWVLARSFGFKGVTLHQWVPKSPLGPAG